MATFDEIRAANPLAVPVGTDLVVVQKADGTPAAFTLDELTAFVVGGSTPQWQIDAAHGCYLKCNESSPINTIAMFNEVIRDSGFYASNGTIIIPAGVVRVQIVAQVKVSSEEAPVIAIVRNGDDTVPVVKVKGAGNYALAVSPEVDVVPGETYSIQVTGSTGVIDQVESFFNVRTIEKTI
jgi:hypothetical protein